MLLREHPRIQWPPHWSEYGSNIPKGEQGTLTDVDLVGPTQILLGNEFQGKVHFAELRCSNPAFTNKLYERMAALLGRPMKDIGALEIER